MASGVTWTRGGHADFVSTPSRQLNKFRPRLYARMEQVMQEAAEYAKRITETSGTVKSGKAGRIDTRDMVDAIGYEVFQRANDQIVGELGFVGQKAFYFYLQTQTGFVHVNSGEFIEPTLALEKAAQEAFIALLKRRY